MIYVGLTDDLERRYQEHGSPADWKATGPFNSEAVARQWESQQLAKPGTAGGSGGTGWRYGYWFTVK